MALAGASPITSELFLADRTGAIRRQVGRKGDGPGEYRGAGGITELPSAYVILDRLAPRMTLLDRRTLEVKKTLSIPASVMRYLSDLPLAFPDGSFVVAAQGTTRGTAGLWLHEITSEGQLGRSFGEREVDGLTRSGDSAFWTFNSDAYRLEKWTKDGELVMAVERRSGWDEFFASPSSPDPRGPGDRRAQLQDIREDAKGRLWVQLYSNLLGEVEVRDQDGKPYKYLGGVPGSLEVRVEVLDVESGRVITTRSWSEWGLPPALTIDGGFHHHTERERERGAILVDVWALRLQRGGGHE